MADPSDVAGALATLLGTIIYPDGEDQPPVTPWPVTIYPGWPIPEDLNRDLAPLGDCDGPGDPLALHLTIWGLPTERNTSRAMSGHPEDMDLDAATYTITSLGQVITIAGVAANPYRVQNLGIFINNLPYTHQATAGETAADIAAAFGVLIGVDWPGVSVMGPDITIPALGRIGALRVGVFGTSAHVVGQQIKGFQITIWADNNENRVILAKIVDPELRALTRLTLPDGSLASVTYKASGDIDRAQRQGFYRRDFIYEIEYATVLERRAPQMIVGRTDYHQQSTDALMGTVYD